MHGRARTSPLKRARPPRAVWFLYGVGALTGALGGCQGKTDSRASSDSLPAPSLTPDGADLLGPAADGVGVDTGRQRALCRTDRDCPLDESCCPSGLMGMCSRLDSAGACPAPDLTLSIPSFRPQIVNRIFPPDDCLLQKCVSGRGARRLLSFPVDVANVGSGDIILMLPDAPGVRHVSCDNSSFLDDFLRYELVDADDVQRASGTGNIGQACFLQFEAQSTSPFDCESQGLAARSYRSLYQDSECQWVDITTLPPGDYTLRISVNAGRQLTETSFDNNQIELPVTVPPNNPLAPCEDDVADPAFYNDTIECGWQPVAGLTAVSCVPGELVTPRCTFCEGSYYPRVCPGVYPCSSAASLTLASFSSTVDAACSSDPVCDAEPTCAELAFACPAIGLYTVLGLPDYDYSRPDLRPRAPSSVSCEPGTASNDAEPAAASDAGTPPLPEP